MNHKNQTGASCSVPFSLIAAFLSASVLSCSQFQIEQIKAEREIDYLRYGEKFPSTAPAWHSYAVHVEPRDSIPDELDESMRAKNKMMRHPEAAGYALAFGGQEASHRAVSTHVMDTNFFTGTVDKTNPSPEEKKSFAINRQMLKDATVITISMQEFNSVFDATKTQSYKQAWKDSNAIVLQSGGNMARRNCTSSKKSASLPQEYHFLQLADTYLRVGAARFDAKGYAMISDYSDCGASDFVALNPYETGLKYQFIPTQEEFQETDKNPSASEALSTFRRKYAVGRDNNILRGISGTSFTTPYTGGHIAGQHELHPELSEYDLVAAALIAARPITKIEKEEPVGITNLIIRNIEFRERKTPSIADLILQDRRNVKTETPPLTYVDNGAGLPYDEKRAGFGFLDFDTYAVICSTMAEWQKNDPSLKTEEKIVTATTQSPSVDTLTTVPKGYKAYTIKMTDSMTVLRAMLSIDIDTLSSPIYDMTLRSPSGKDIILLPHPAEKRNIGYAPTLASTNGFTGNEAKGDWQILVPENVIINKAEITIAGAQKNGLIDKAINHFAALKKETSFQDESKKKPETINDPALLPKIQMIAP